MDFHTLVPTWNSFSNFTGHSTKKEVQTFQVEPKRSSFMRVSKHEANETEFSYFWRHFGRETFWLNGERCRERYVITSSRFRHFIISSLPFHHFIISSLPFHHFIISSPNHSIISSFHHFIPQPSSLFHHFIISSPNHFIISSFHQFIPTTQKA